MDLSLLGYSFVAVICIATGLAFMRFVWICTEWTKEKFGFGELGWFVSLVIFTGIPLLTVPLYFYIKAQPDSEK